MLTGINIALVILSILVLGLTFFVSKIFRILRDITTAPAIEVTRARRRFLFELESRIRTEANTSGDTAPFATRLLDMLAEHHQNMDELDEKRSEEMLNKFRGKATK